MSKPSIESSEDRDLALSLPAMRRAMLRARDIARQTRTKVVVMIDGKIEHVDPDDPRFDLVE